MKNLAIGCMVIWALCTLSGYLDGDIVMGLAMGTGLAGVCLTTILTVVAIMEIIQWMERKGI